MIHACAAAGESDPHRWDPLLVELLPIFGTHIFGVLVDNFARIALSINGIGRLGDVCIFISHALCGQ